MDVEDAALSLVTVAVGENVTQLVLTISGGAYRSALRPDCEELAELAEQAACLTASIEDGSTPAEFWTVDAMLAAQLLARDERVDEDFAGLCVWARMNGGQPIEADAVVRRIAVEWFS